MNKIFNYANVQTPKPSCQWIQKSDVVRLELVNSVLLKNKYFNEVLAIRSARVDGQVIVSFLKPIGAELRGALLLDFEDELKRVIDPALNVWLESLGDKNSLRNLRGITVKS